MVRGVEFDVGFFLEIPGDAWVLFKG